MFLAVPKAISKVKDTYEGAATDREEQFFSDLTGWQKPFASEEAKLHALRTAVSDIWNAKL